LKKRQLSSEVKKKIIRQKFGGGDEDTYIEEYEDANIYIPKNPSPNSCLYNCLVKVIPESILRPIFDDFIKKYKVYKGLVP